MIISICTVGCRLGPRRCNPSVWEGAIICFPHLTRPGALLLEFQALLNIAFSQPSCTNQRRYLFWSYTDTVTNE
jgi:hypothetical protein